MTVAGDAPPGTSYGATVAASPVPNVQVIAPATLQAGYTFDAMYDGVTFTVVVPDGGVTKGQRFIVPFAPPTKEAVAVAVPAEDASFIPKGQVKGTSGGAGSHIPTGIWRDGLCDCCTLGPCHPSLWNAWCFLPFLVGQVLTRMKMTWLGRREVGSGGEERWRKSFRNLAIVWFLFYMLNSLTTVPLDFESDDPTEVDYELLSDEDKMKYTLNSWITALFGFYIFYVLIQLRASIRHAYRIPEESCRCLYCGSDPRDGACNSKNSGACASGVPVGWEDVCCAAWCQCCVAAQMARHTADYEGKRAVCCNEVGVEEWEDDEAYEGTDADVGEGSVLVV